MSVDVQFMCDIPVPLPKDRENQPRTGFSFSRFLIPSLCQYRGKAIYLDADMLVFDDIAKLWDYPLASAKANRNRQRHWTRHSSRPRFIHCELLDDGKNRHTAFFAFVPRDGFRTGTFTLRHGSNQPRRCLGDAQQRFTQRCLL
ncbi:MAG: hypothetical protein FJ145_24490 [Deltaproteobacteria bacterium]|nr:hypothetical protein [Deltaproteobacteria bacterium]